MNAFLHALRLGREARRFRRLARALCACYPQHQVVLVYRDRLESMKDALAEARHVALWMEPGPIRDRLRKALEQVIP